MSVATSHVVTTAMSRTVCVPVGSSSSTTSVRPDADAAVVLAGSRFVGQTGGSAAKVALLEIKVESGTGDFELNVLSGGFGEKKGALALRALVRRGVTREPIEAKLDARGADIGDLETDVV